MRQSMSRGKRTARVFHGFASATIGRRGEADRIRLEGEETERWQEYLGVTRVSEGKNDRKRLQGWWQEGGESFKGRRQQGREEVAGGRLTGGQKKRSPIKVGRGGCEQWHQELWRERSEAKRNVPALAVMPFTLCNLCSSLSYQVLLCVCVTETWECIRQERRPPKTLALL